MPLRSTVNANFLGWPYFMRSGRPAYHVRAKWISVLNSSDEALLYELDKKGSLVKSDGKVSPCKRVSFNKKPPCCTSRQIVQGAASFDEDAPAIEAKCPTVVDDKFAEIDTPDLYFADIFEDTVSGWDF